MKDVDIEVRLALLEKSNAMLNRLAITSLAIIFPLATYTINSATNKGKAEAKIEWAEKSIEDLTKSLNLTNDDLGAIQTWADEQFINKEVFETYIKNR